VTNANDPLSVLLLTDLYSPVVGGLEGHVQALARSLARRGHRVTVVTQRHPGAPDRERADGVEVRRIDGWSRFLGRFYEDPAYRFLPPAPDPGLVRALKAIVDEIRPQIVHAHSWILYSALALPSRLRSYATLMTLHDYGLGCARKTLVQRGGGRCSGPALLKCLACAPGQYGLPVGTALVTSLRASRPLHRRVDRFLAVSSSVQTRVREYAEGTPVEVVPNFLAADVTALASRERPTFLPQGDGYLLYVGELSAHKGVDVLVRAYQRLADPPPLVLIGRRVPGLELDGIDGVVVVPGAARPDVVAAFQHASIAFVPSVWDEPCPTVALEAMACGRPLIASRVGGLPDIVADGETGILVPHADDAALAGATLELVADEPRRERFGAAARQRAALFSEAVVVGRIEAAYHDAFANVRVAA
jgi:glycosyltransferase involved in cell wall biosynthesis